MKVLTVNTDGRFSRGKVLEKEGFVVERAGEVEQAVELSSLYFYDVVLFETRNPDRRLDRSVSSIKKNDPRSGIIIVSPPVHVQKKIELLMAGADDYIVEPFAAEELLARIKTLVRRCSMQGRYEISFAEVTIEPASRRVRCCGKTVRLTRKEYELLLFFLRNTDKVLSHETIAEYLWGDLKSLTSDCFDFIYCHIKNIRRKLSLAGARPFIDTVYGVGYVVR